MRPYLDRFARNEILSRWQLKNYIIPDIIQEFAVSDCHRELTEKRGEHNRKPI